MPAQEAAHQVREQLQELLSPAGYDATSEGSRARKHQARLLAKEVGQGFGCGKVEVRGEVVKRIERESEGKAANISAACNE